MSEDLLRIVSAELRQISAQTADCPHLIHRVTVGVQRRRNRQRRFAILVVAAAVAITVPFLRAGSDSAGSRVVVASAPSLGCAASTSSATCAVLLSQRAQLALVRANPPILLTASARDIRSSSRSACQHRPTCPV